MVLNDIIEQAAGRQSQTPEQGGNFLSVRISFVKKAQRKYIVFLFFSLFLVQFFFSPPVANVYILFIVR